MDGHDAAVVHECAADDPHRRNRAAARAAHPGEKAHSRYFSESAFAAAAQPKELLVIPGANHVDLYDRLDLIPFDRMAAFFETHLKPAGAGHA